MIQSQTRPERERERAWCGIASDHSAAACALRGICPVAGVAPSVGRVMTQMACVGLIVWRRGARDFDVAAAAAPRSAGKSRWRRARDTASVMTARAISSVSSNSSSSRRRSLPTISRLTGCRHGSRGGRIVAGVNFCRRGGARKLC